MPRPGHGETKNPREGRPKRESVTLTDRPQLVSARTARALVRRADFVAVSR
jgi:hypothetical protein